MTNSNSTFPLLDADKAAKLFPPLSQGLKKGDCGKIGIIGGSPLYTGAPYFAAYTSIKIGADLSYLFCHPDASPIIKSYSPELMVNPTLDFQEIQTGLGRLDAIVFGSGIGRDKEKMVPLLQNVLAYTHRTPNVCLVIDADGLFLLNDCLEAIQNCKNAILTPNHNEFERLYKKVFEEEDDQTEDKDQQKVKKLANKLGVCILRKGDTDVISDGEQVLLGETEGAARRCGGQGDILSGASALFIYWHRLKQKGKEYTTENLLQGALAASDFVRLTSRLTFQKIGRGMNAADIIEQMPEIVKKIDDSVSANQ